MRIIDVPEQADILVSELLGSFGDNELSPECLDGAGRFLKREWVYDPLNWTWTPQLHILHLSAEGISIPATYTAHLAPLSSSKLHGEVRAHASKKSKNELVAYETPYVVMFQQVNLLSGEATPNDGRCGGRIQECWGFEHPRRDVVWDARGVPLTNSHNTRAARLSYRIPHAGTLHGFAGYFEAHLYGSVGDIITAAAPPSLITEAFPAVVTPPSLKAGFIFASCS